MSDEIPNGSRWMSRDPRDNGRTVEVLNSDNGRVLLRNVKTGRMTSCDQVTFVRRNRGGYRRLIDE